MSTTIETDVPVQEIVEFVLDEHVHGTGIPVHPFSAVNCTFSSYNRCLGITDGNGTLFHTADDLFTAYGCDNNFYPMLNALRQCGVNFFF